MRESLTVIANRYGTDKGTEGPTASWRGHNYTDIYEAYLWPLRGRPIRLLEIGLGVTGDAWDAKIETGRNTGGGASIKMWADYFPQAQVFGVDINPASHLDTDRVHTFVCDQGDPASLAKVYEWAGGQPFDVVIDDGSHRADHQQITFGALFDRVVPGGFYFVEDLFDNGSDEFTQGRMASRCQVLSTRRVFRQLADTGRFGTPNSIEEADRHAVAVEWVHLHVPMNRFAVAYDLGARFKVKAMTKFRPSSETMVVVRRAS